MNESIKKTTQELELISKLEPAFSELARIPDITNLFIDCYNLDSEKDFCGYDFARSNKRLYSVLMQVNDSIEKALKTFQNINS